MIHCALPRTCLVLILLNLGGLYATGGEPPPLTASRREGICEGSYQPGAIPVSSEVAPHAVPIQIVTGLVVESLGPRYSPDAHRVIVQQTRADAGGSTSIRNVDADHLEWKPQGYFQRNRDLGQVFTAPRDFCLDAVVIRTGPSDAAVGMGAPGGRVFVEFFEVVGDPILDDNGTPQGSEATHGFSKNHRCDDFLRGVEYRPFLVVRGGVFPDLPPTRNAENEPTGDSTGKLTYLRWRFADTACPRFAAGKRYAIIFGFEEPGEARTFTLANANAAGVNAPARLGDAHDPYPHGWAIRREGDGSRPPLMVPDPNPPQDGPLLQRLLRQSLFADGASRFLLAPGTDGYPDVDTYRDLEFYLETTAWSFPTSEEK
ncbi:MAG: hypothetical protein ACUVTH_00205 [Thermogutta sp.]